MMIANQLSGVISNTFGSITEYVGAIAAKRTVTSVGDSLMAHGDNSRFGETVGQGHTSQSTIGWANSQLPGGALAVVANRAVGGTLIDGAATNSLIGTNTPQLPAAITDNSDILWIHSGINHLNPAIDASSPTVAQILSKFRRLLDLAAPQKQLVVVDALCPVNAGASAPTGAAARRADIPRINAGLAAIASTYRNVRFNDVYTPLALDQAGNANPSYVLSTDGIHLTSWGAYLVGLTSAANLYRWLSPAQAFRPTKNVTLPDFSGAGGTKTPNSGTILGNVASNFVLVIASGTSVVTASVADGKQTLVIDNTAGGATSAIQLKLVNPAGYLGSLANGDTVIAFTKIEVTSQSNMRRCNFVNMLNPSGSPVNNVFLGRSSVENSGGVVPNFPPAFSGIYVTDPFTFGAAPASVDVPVTIEVAAGGIATVSISGLGYNAVAAV